MQELEKALGEAERQSFVFKTHNPNEEPLYKKAEAQKQKDFLYFPRRKLKMRKILSGNWQPSAWFIERRLSQEATSLTKPVSESQEGLTSGYRSAIVLNNNQEYVRLKGVAMKGLGTQGGKRGCQEVLEAFLEILNSNGLNRNKFYFIAMQPSFFEGHIRPREEASLAEFLNLFNRQRVAMEFGKSSYIGDDLIEAYQSNPHIERMNIVTAYKIVGDTRLDETVWHLTKREIHGREETVRNSLLDMLFFRAGIAKAYLALDGFGWGHSLKYTNSHTGNFVICPIRGGVNVAIADLGLMKHESFEDETKLIPGVNQESRTKAEFQEHLEKELAGFQDDIFDNATYSMTAQQKYRFFPQELRQRCFDALKTGYAVTILKYRKKYKDVVPSIPAGFDVVVPERFFIADSEFREDCRKLAS